MGIPFIPASAAVLTHEEIIQAIPMAKDARFRCYKLQFSEGDLELHDRPMPDADEQETGFYQRVNYEVTQVTTLSIRLRIHFAFESLEMSSNACSSCLHALDTYHRSGVIIILSIASMAMLNGMIKLHSPYVFTYSSVKVVFVEDRDLALHWSQQHSLSECVVWEAGASLLSKLVFEDIKIRALHDFEMPELSKVTHSSQ